jgi:hypothetical protein
MACDYNASTRRREYDKKGERRERESLIDMVAAQSSRYRFSALRLESHAPCLLFMANENFSGLLLLM